MVLTSRGLLVITVTGTEQLNKVICLRIAHAVRILENSYDE